MQAVFEDGAVLLNVSQSASAVRIAAQGENHPWDILVSVIPALRSNVDDVSDIIELLVELAESQADTSAKAGLDTSIGIRDVTRFNGVDLPSGLGSGVRETLRGEYMDVAHDQGALHDGSDGEMVDFGDVLGPRPMKTDHGDPAGMFGITGHGMSDTSIDRSYEAMEGLRPRGESVSESVVSIDKDTPSNTTGWGLPESEITLVNPPKVGVNDFIDEEGA